MNQRSAQLKTALVTGASVGIGRDLAIVLAEHGHDLVITARNQDQLEALAAELRSKHHVKVEVIAADLAKPQAPSEIFDEVARRGIAIDMLVNNAGFGGHGRFDREDVDEILGMVQVNIAALTHLTRLFLPPMVERGFGRVMNVAIDSGVPARAADGGLLRDQGVCAELLRSDCIGVASHWSARDGALPRADQHRIPATRRRVECSRLHDRNDDGIDAGGAHRIPCDDGGQARGDHRRAQLDSGAGVTTDAATIRDVDCEKDERVTLICSTGFQPVPEVEMDLLDTQIFSIIGEDGFTQLVAAFYRRVPTDDLLGPMYKDHDLTGAEQRLCAFLIQRFGGPDHYSQQRGHPRLRMRHGPFHIDNRARSMDRADGGGARRDKPAGRCESRAARAFFHDSATFMMNR